MPQPRDPLPSELRGRAFHVATARGVSQRRLAAADLWSPTRGVRLPATALDLRSRCRAHLLTLPPGAAFSHTTAGELQGLPLPASLAGGPVHVTVPLGTRAPHRKGVIGHQRALGDDEVIRISGLTVTSLPRTFTDLAGLLGLEALIAVGDRMLWRGGPLTSRDELERAVERTGGMRGARRAHAALERLDDGAESPKETELRLLLLAAGLGPFASNFVLHDDRGAFVARVDLALPSLRIAIEYEGDHHRDREQFRRDMARRRRIEALGWFYLPVSQADLTDPRGILSDLASAIVRRG